MRGVTRNMTNPVDGPYSPRHLGCIRVSIATSCGVEHRVQRGVRSIIVEGEWDDTGPDTSSTAFVMKAENNNFWRIDGNIGTSGCTGLLAHDDHGDRILDDSNRACSSNIQLGRPPRHRY